MMGALTMAGLATAGVAIVSRGQDITRAADPYRAAIVSAAREAGVSPYVLMALIWNESRFNPHAEGSAGEVGLTQMRSIAAEDIGLSLDSLRNDPEAQISAGAQYLALMIKRAGGDLVLGVRAYNAGLTGARNNPTAGLNYAGRVLFDALAAYIMEVLSGA